MVVCPVVSDISDRGYHAPDAIKLSNEQILLTFKGIEGSMSKVSISFVLIYVVNLSCFFPKWGFRLLQKRYFRVYDQLLEGYCQIQGFDDIAFTQMIIKSKAKLVE